MALSKQEVRDLYVKRAKRYDLGLKFYGLFGFRLDWYRRLAVESLSLQAGDTVIDLACGTGLNFEYFQWAVGNTGQKCARRWQLFTGDPIDLLPTGFRQQQQT